MKRLLYFILVVISLFSARNAVAQDVLFEYPVAPDTCTNIESRCNYSVQHFWEKCDLGKPFEAKNDSLLAEAMVTYFEIMKAGANVNVSLSSVRDLMFKAQANHDNFTKLLAIAEYLLYYHDFEFIDDLYLTFAKCGMDATWMKKELRNHYGEQYKRIEASKLGSPIYNFEYTGITGTHKHIADCKSGAELYVIIMSDSGSGSSIERMRLSADVAFGQLVESGKVKVINIMLGDAPKKWDSDSRSYSSTWEVGASKDVESKLDLRIVPCIYLLDENFNVVGKNKTVDFVLSLVNG